jgi:hypothetical protein
MIRGLSTSPEKGDDAIQLPDGQQLDMEFDESAYDSLSASSEPELPVNAAVPIPNPAIPPAVPVVPVQPIIALDDSGGSANDLPGNVIGAASPDADSGGSARRSTRVMVPTERFLQSVASAPERKVHVVTSPEATHGVAPTNVRAALNDPEWARSMAEELSTLEEHGVWEVVPRPANAHVLKTGWVFTVKSTSETGIVQLKSRLVARGDLQKPDSFEEVFAPVASARSFRTLMAIAAGLGFKRRTFDVKSAFTQSDIDRPIYVEPPVGLNIPDGYVLKLLRSLYGLRQAALLWYEALKTALIQAGFKPTVFDSALFYRKSPSGIIFANTVVDDILSVASCDELLDEFDSILSSAFVIKVTDLTRYVGYRITDYPDMVVLQQADKISALLADYSMQRCRPCPVPWNGPPPSPFVEGEDETVDVTQYRKLLGSLSYIAGCTRPDISACVNWHARFAAKPALRHYDGLIQVLRYLKSTQYLALAYHKDVQLELQVSCDASFDSDRASHKSTSGILISLAGGLVTWQSKRQNCIARSSHDAEITAATDAVEQVIQLRGLLAELGLPMKQATPVFMDSKSGMASINADQYQSTKKNVRRDMAILRDAVNTKHVRTLFVPGRFNPSDALTKPLPTYKFLEHVGTMNMVDVRSFIR